MKKEYNLTLEQALQLSSEYLQQSPKRKRAHRRLIFLAVGLACGFAVLKPAHASFNGQESRLVAVLLTICIQIPFVSFISYALLRLYFDMPLRIAAKLLRKQPPEFWGRRTLEVADAKLILDRDVVSHSFKTSFVEDVVETASGYHLRHGEQVLVSIPKNACSVEELRAALK